MKSRFPKLKNNKKKVLRKAYLAKYNTPKLASYRDASNGRSGLSLSYMHNPQTILQAIEEPQIAQLSLNDKLRGIRQAKHGKTISDSPERYSTISKHIMIEFAPDRLVAKKTDRPNILFNPMSFHD